MDGQHSENERVTKSNTAYSSLFRDSAAHAEMSSQLQYSHEECRSTLM